MATPGLIQHNEEDVVRKVGISSYLSSMIRSLSLTPVQTLPGRQKQSSGCPVNY